MATQNNRSDYFAAKTHNKENANYRFSKRLKDSKRIVTNLEQRRKYCYDIYDQISSKYSQYDYEKFQLVHSFQKKKLLKVLFWVCIAQCLNPPWACKFWQEDKKLNCKLLT